MTERSTWLLQGEKVGDPFHYTGCGLDDIYLLSGYEVKQTPEGETVTIKRLDGLHRAIGRYLVSREKLLAGKEIRFLRKQVDLTQSELARLFGCDAQQIARYEKNENKIPGPADRLLRLIYECHLSGSVQVIDLLRNLDALDATMKETGRVFKTASNPDGWKAAA